MDDRDPGLTDYLEMQSVEEVRAWEVAGGIGMLQARLIGALGDGEVSRAELDEALTELQAAADDVCALLAARRLRLAAAIFQGRAAGHG